MKRVSVYLKGDQNSPNYYRIYQYTNRINDMHFAFKTMMPIKIHNKYMPISKKPIHIKVFVQAIIYFRVLFYLIQDYICKPSAIVITRRVINRIMPWSYKYMLGRLSNQVPIIWDFDDDIIEGKEVSVKTFNFYSKISDVIFCTHQGLKDLVPKQYQHKVKILATTDGDLFGLYNYNVKQNRLKSFKDTLKIVWVATSVNIPHLIDIAPVLDKYAEIVKKQYGKIVELSVICNEPLNYNFKNIILKNVKWTRECAINGILKAHIGIMPLKNTRYSRGKGGFKLVQYISAGLPCIGSDVGFNKNIIDGNCGYLAKNEEDWGEALLALADVDNWEKCSENAYRRFLDKFSFNENLNIWKSTFKRLIDEKK